MKFYCCVVVFLLSNLSCSYTQNLTVLDRNQAISDIDYLVTKIREIHPDPFLNIDEKEFYRHVRKMKNKLPSMIKRKDFSLVIAELLALIGDDHTRHGRLDSPDYRAYWQSGNLFPLKLRYNDNGMNVDGWAESVKPKRLKKGDRIVAINGKSMEILLKEYRNYISAKSEIQKNWILEQNFDFYFWAKEGEQKAWNLLLNSKGEEYIEIIPAAQINNCIGQKKNKENNLFPFRFYMDNKVCFLKASSFDTWSGFSKGKNNVYQVWVNTLDELFTAMNDSGTVFLIVDLRENPGGNGSLGWELIMRTASKPFKTGSKKWRYSRAYQEAWLIAGLKMKGIPAWFHFEKHLDLRNFVPGPDPSKLKGEYFIAENSVVTPYLNSWKGKLILLTDRHTGSAAVSTAVIVKDNHLGIVAGEETGGPASYFSELAPILLPNSGLFCGISSAYSLRPAEFDDGHGVQPDLPLDLTLPDVVLIKEILSNVGDKAKK